MSAKGFYSKGKGRKRKVIPINASSGKRGRNMTTASNLSTHKYQNFSTEKLKDMLIERENGAREKAIFAQALAERGEVTSTYVYSEAADKDQKEANEIKHELAKRGVNSNSDEEMEYKSRVYVKKHGYENVVVVHGAPSNAIAYAESRRKQIYENFNGNIPKESQSEKEYNNLGVYISKVKKGQFQHSMD